MQIKTLDEKAKRIAKNYLHLESELLDVIMQLDRLKAVYKIGYASLFHYVTEALHLSSAQAYSLISVARKSNEIPELKNEVANGLSLYKAQRVVSVINNENKQQWLELAKTKTQRQLERAVALASPRLAVPEKTTYLAPGETVQEKVVVMSSLPRLKMELGLSEELMLKLRRAQDLEVQRQRQKVDLEETLEAILDVYLERRDPVRKAQRQKAKGKWIDEDVVVGDSHHTQPAGEICREEKSQHGSLKRVECQSKKSMTNSARAEPTLGSMLSKGAARSPGQRKPLPAQVVHQVNLRDGGRCTYKDKLQRQCRQRRYLEIHHIKPVALGGSNELKNLATVCSGHHKVIHQRE